MRTHTYRTSLHWTAGDGEGTKNYRAYSREHTIAIEGKEPIRASSDPAFRGDANYHNPEELLVASLSSCHMLWYLHLCATNGITVVDYCDRATGTMEEEADGGGRFTRVLLHPTVKISSGDPTRALELHHEAHRLCFIARSVNFPVDAEPEIVS